MNRMCVTVLVRRRRGARLKFSVSLRAGCILIESRRPGRRQRRAGARSSAGNSESVTVGSVDWEPEEEATCRSDIASCGG